MKVGILLPTSGTHPLVAYFMDGMYSHLHFHELSAQITYVTASIGFGTDAAVIEREASKLIMEDRADLLVVYADYPVISSLFPLMEALNKLLIVVNLAAQYPTTWKARPNVIHHTLANLQCCWLTGMQAANEYSSAAFVSSFYDGGYSINHALNQSFINNGGMVDFNFSGHQYKEQFDISPLLNYLDGTAETTAILAILSGELVAEFHQQLGAFAGNNEVKLYTSPVMLEESQLNLSRPHKLTVSGYTSWHAGLANRENMLFCQQFERNSSRIPDSFAVLGWDTAVLLKTIHEIYGDAGINGSAVSKHPLMQQLQGAKGPMQLDPYTQYYLSPVDYLSINADGKLTVKHTLSQQRVTESFNIIINQQIEGVSSQWLNTYLCS